MGPAPPLSELQQKIYNFFCQSRVLQSFDVEEKHGFYLEQRYGNVTVRTAHMTSLEHRDKVGDLSMIQTISIAALDAVLYAAVTCDLLVQVVECSDGSRLHYDKLCLCTGAKPKVSEPHSDAKIITAGSCE